MPYRRPRRSSAAVRRLFVSGRQLSLVPQPALSQVSVHGSRSLAQQASRQPVASGVLSRGLHPAGTTGTPCTPQPTLALRPAVSAASETLLQIAADPHHLGARIGVLAVLHTWSQNLRHHPHLHCLVPAGGLARDHSRWIACRPGFFLPVRVLSRLFRGKMLAFLKQAYKQGELRCLGTAASLAEPRQFYSLLRLLRHKEWVVYSKPPFGGPEHVLKYLARYTHRV